MNKHLVYNFYIFPEWEKNEVNQIHLNCLRKEINKFDRVTFVIMIDNINDVDSINNFEKTILDLKFKGELTFKISENNDFRESKTFYNEVICSNDNELLFFGHNKGVTNILKYKKEEIYNWIVGMYFFNFYNIKDVEDKLINRKGLSYGAYLSYNEEEYNIIKYHWAYIGTFFWINNLKLKAFLENNEYKLPTLCDRFYDEELLGNTFPCCNWPFAFTLTDTYLINAMDFYNNAINYTNILLKTEELKEEFNIYYKSVINYE